MDDPLASPAAHLDLPPPISLSGLMYIQIAIFMRNLTLRYINAHNMLCLPVVAAG